MSVYLIVEPPTVQVGQVWHDPDKRRGSRHCRIIAADAFYATLRQCMRDGTLPVWPVVAPRPTIVSIQRLQTRWKLVRDVAVKEAA